MAEVVASMEVGAVTEVAPGVRRILAGNPSVMTGPGTNTYLVGTADVAVIDPGPDDLEAHLDAVAEAGAGRIRWILVTHTHPDHAPGAAGLKQRTGAAVLGFDERDGFVPDETIGDDWHLETADFRLRALHTPGHASNHLCYRLDDDRLLFSGDHIMSGSTVVIAPPDGDMAAYLAALDAVRGIDIDAIAPGHGPFIDEPVPIIEQYIVHRLARESAIRAALETRRSATIAELVSDVYTDVPDALHPIARFSVWAHLRKLDDDGLAVAIDRDDVEARWSSADFR